MLELVVYFSVLGAFLIILVRSAIFAIDSVVKLCKIAGISELAAGFIIIAVSTNLPEFSVAVFSTYTKNVELTIGDVFGSNVTNTALIAAIFLLLSPVRRLDKKTAKGIFPLLIPSVIPLLLLLLNQGDKLTGILLLGVFALFVYQTFRTHKRESRVTLGSGSHYRPLFFFLLGMTLVIVSARMVVTSASLIAESTGIEQSVIGGTIIALGTSLPELTVDIVAVKRKHLNLALGDIIGSCVINITLILGIVLVLSEVHIDFSVFQSLAIFAAIAPLILFLFLRAGRIAKWQIVFLLIIYAAFLVVMYQFRII